MDGINEKSMFLLPVDENEVLKIVNDCKSKSSEDNDNLSMRFVKDILNHTFRNHLITSVIYLSNQELFKIE